MPPFPRSLTRHVERPEPTPAERFDAYLAEHEPEDEPLPPRPVPTRAAWVRALLLLVIVFGAAIGWLGWRVVG